MLKRFKSQELGESASRRVGYDCIADYAKSSRAMCRVCKQNIEQNELRLALMLQDDEGYKSAAWTHFDCFWKHPETSKLVGTHEIHNFSTLKAVDRARISAAFEKSNSNNTTGKKKNKSKSKKSLDSDDEDFSLESKPTATTMRRKAPAAKKRKRDLEDD